MKKIFALLAVAALPAAGFAQAPALTFVKSINVGGTAISPHGVAIVGDRVFAAGFSNQVLFYVDNIAGTESITALPALSAPAWGASRGPQDFAYDATNDILYAIGDDGTNGRLYAIATPTGTPSLTGPVQPGTVSRFCGGVFYGNNLIVGRSNSSAFQQIAVADAAQAAVSTNGATASPAGFGSPHRDFAVHNDVVYVLNNTTGATRLATYTPTTAGDISAGTWGQVDQTLTTGAPANYIGLAKWTNATTTFIVAPYNDTVTGRGVAFYDTANLAAAPTVLRPTELNGETLAGIAIGNIGGTTYLILSSNTGGATANELHVFSLPANASVSDWTMF